MAWNEHWNFNEFATYSYVCSNEPIVCIYDWFSYVVFPR